MNYVITTDGTPENVLIVEDGRPIAGIKEVRVIADNEKDLAELILKRNFHINERTGGLSSFAPKYRVVSDGYSQNTQLLIDNKMIDEIILVDFGIDQDGLKIVVKTAEGEERTLVDTREENRKRRVAKTEAETKEENK